jgi:hypothetical protein
MDGIGVRKTVLIVGLRKCIESGKWFGTVCWGFLAGRYEMDRCNSMKGFLILGN